MKRLLLQLDADRHPSSFDRIVALDAGADEVLSYGGVTPDDVAPLVHGAIFTRGGWISGPRLSGSGAVTWPEPKP